MKKIIKIYLLATLCCTLLLSCDDYEKKPNVLIIMADDMGYFDLSIYGSDIQTPHLDKLAAEGMLLTSFFSAAPNCSPARAGLLTGRIPSRTGIYDWVPDNGPMHLPESEVTLAELLRANGYSTCHVGKWHLAMWSKTDGLLSPDPGAQGFDHWFAVDNNAIPSHKNPINFKRNGISTGDLEGFSCQLVVDEGIKWLKDREDKDQPFFLNVWFNEPHKKLASPPELMARHQNLSEGEALYYANIENLDLAAGRLLKELDELGLADNTIVIFTSDNGPWRAQSAGHFRGKKSELYDGGIREPGIIRWPGHVEAGSYSDYASGFVDILPTICEITGSALPEETHLDGTSLLPLIQGDDVEREQPLFWFHYKSSPAAAIRDGAFVLTADPANIYRSRTHFFDRTDLEYLKHLNFEVFQLFNVNTDPGQEKNIAADHPEIVERLKTELIRIYTHAMAEGPNWEGLPPDAKMRPKS